jgi:hypothetical protein
MTEEQLEDLRQTLQDWQDGEEVTDRDMRDALRKLADELR